LSSIKGQKPKKHITTTEDYIRLVQSLINLGITRLYFTGGEPLLSPKLDPILASIPPHNPEDFKVIIATNGVLLGKKLDSLKTKHIDKFKISLHAFSDDTMWKIEKLRCIEDVKEAIRKTVEIFPEVEINALLMPENQHEIMDMIQFARDLGIVIEVLELVWTDYNRPVYTEKKLSTHDLANMLVQQGGKERVDLPGIGVNLKVVEFENSYVKLMDNELGSHYVGTCNSCPLKSACVEGFWAIRVDSEGFAQPCLLRSDLRTDLKPLLDDQKKLEEFLPLWIGAFMKGEPLPQTEDVL
jgi:cyclic pyranopterin phosphate synthase